MDRFEALRARVNKGEFLWPSDTLKLLDELEQLRAKLSEAERQLAVERTHVDDVANSRRDE